MNRYLWSLNSQEGEQTVWLRPYSATVLTVSLCLSMSVHCALAQGTAAPIAPLAAPALQPPPAAGQTTDNMNTSLPSPGTDTTAAQPGTGLTLADVVRITLGNSTSLVAARQRLARAQELIEQVKASDRPQIRLDANDSYSSFDTTAPSLPSLTIQNPLLPGGGVIPTIVDAGGNFSGGFIGLGGNSSGSTAVLTPGEGNTTLPPGAYVQTTEPAQDGATPQAEPAAPQAGQAAPAAARTKQATPQAEAPHKKSVLKTAAEAAIPILAAGFLTQSSDEDKPDNSQSVSPLDASQAVDASNAATGSLNKPANTNLNNYAARLSIIQYIDVFGLVPTAKNAVRDVRDFYSLDVERIKNETALAAKNLFFNALFAQAQVDTQQEQVDDATENVTMTESRFHYGFVSRLDVLTAQTALASAQQQLIAAQAQRNLSQASLGYLLGTDMTRQLNLIAPALPPLDATVDVRQSMQTALANRPEMAQAGKDIDEAHRLVKIAGSALLPAVGLVASGEDTNTGSPSIPYDYASIGAMVYFPLGDGGATRSRVRSAKVDVQAQDLALNQLRLTIGLEVQQVAYTIGDAQAQVKVAQTAESQAEQAVSIARERYQAGLGTFLDILNSLAQLARTRTNLSVSEYLYQTSLAQLVRTMGGR